MRQLYQFFEKQKWSPLGTKISISHIRQFFSLTDSNEINYYAMQIKKRNLSKRQLEEAIKSDEYGRLSVETRNKLISSEKLEVNDLIPNPILIKNKNNIEIVTEKDYII